MSEYSPQDEISGSTKPACQGQKIPLERSAATAKISRPDDGTADNTYKNAQHGYLSDFFLKKEFQELRKKPTLIGIGVNLDIF